MVKLINSKIAPETKLLWTESNSINCAYDIWLCEGRYWSKNFLIRIIKLKTIFFVQKSSYFNRSFYFIQRFNHTNQCTLYNNLTFIERTCTVFCDRFAIIIKSKTFVLYTLSYYIHYKSEVVFLRKKEKKQLTQTYKSDDLT